MTASGADDQDDDLAELTHRASGGDERAFERLAQRVEGRIRGWARRWSADADEADDLTQLSLIRLHERIGQFDRRSRVTSWLFRIVQNIAADRRRAETRRAATESRVDTERFAAMDEASESSQHAEEREARLEHLLHGYRALLSRRECEVFELVDLRGVPAAQAATELGLAPATVRVLLLRARRKIRTLMLDDPADAGGGAQ